MAMPYTPQVPTYTVFDPAGTPVANIPASQSSNLDAILGPIKKRYGGNLNNFLVKTPNGAASERQPLSNVPFFTSNYNLTTPTGTQQPPPAPPPPPPGVTIPPIPGASLPSIPGMPSQPAGGGGTVQSGALPGPTQTAPTAPGAQPPTPVATPPALTGSSVPDTDISKFIPGTSEQQAQIASGTIGQAGQLGQEQATSMHEAIDQALGRTIPQEQALAGQGVGALQTLYPDILQKQHDVFQQNLPALQNVLGSQY